MQFDDILFLSSKILYGHFALNVNRKSTVKVDTVTHTSVFYPVNHRNRIFGFRPNMNLRQSKITEYSAKNEYSVITEYSASYRIFGKLPNILLYQEQPTVKLGPNISPEMLNFGNFTENLAILPNIR